mgnify:CR=1 FL=1
MGRFAYAKDLLLETVLDDGSIWDNPVGRTVNPGHAIETSWFLMEEARRRNDSRLLSGALQILEWSLEIGWDPKFGGILYFVDCDGRVYSLNGEQPKVVSAKTGWGGLDWVTLMTRDGWKRFCVGELVAETFMPEGRPGSREEWAVVHLDGNPRNNAVSNLRWATRLQANQLRQDTPTPRTPSAVTTVVAARSGPAAEFPRHAVRSMPYVAIRASCSFGTDLA